MYNDLLSRFRTRAERFTHGDFSVELLLPLSAEELIDESEFNTDERLPYWAELWPSARALTRHLLDGPSSGGRGIELGSGVALPSLALRWKGEQVTATDYYGDALEFARLNADRNGIAPPGTRLLDWRSPPADLGLFDRVFATDVLYERRNVDALVSLLPLITAPGGEVLIADPGRVHAGDFFEMMRGGGWTVREADTLEEPSPAGEDIRIKVRLAELRPPA